MNKKSQALLEQLEYQLKHRPDSIAISYLNKNLTYSELFQRAEQLAQYMLGLGIQPEQKIGIYLERSLDIVVAILATLKISATYVPVDPNYPLNRIQHILNLSNISTIITQEIFISCLNSNIKQAICLDRDWEVISKNFNKSKTINLFLQDDLLAYVLYTSGSTGTPKGVMINRKNLINAYSGWQKAYELTAEDVHLQMASFAFDVFSGDLIRALCSGAKLVLCPREILLNPAALYNLMKEEKINCAEFVPTVLRKLAEYLSQTKQNLDFMRLLVCGSDNWSVGEYKKLKTLCGKQTRLINSYGLTEATIDSTYFEMSEVDENKYCDEDSVPIGRPFENTEIYLLDEKLKPVNHGETGEIYISGAGLAYGYLNQPELTQQKFFNCMIGKRSVRIYKTGDLGFFLEDGNLQLIGRSDNQVKLHGHRIELTEIENNLNQHPVITESLVTMQVDKNSHKRIVAYIVPKSQSRIDTKELRAFLKQHLPTYMIPSIFISLDTLPLLPNGKLDRQFFKNSILDTSFSFKEDFSENKFVKKIIGSLEKYITTDSIAIHDSFSDLGIDSLSLANIVSNLNKQFQIEIETCHLSIQSTIEELAKIIEAKISSLLVN